jgi:K+-transporting ATPase ATPase A chain
MNIEGKASIHTLEGNAVQVARAPAAAMVAIKQLGTNGGGFFGANSSHPLENPTYWSNAIESISIILIPIAMVFALGFTSIVKNWLW